MPLMNLNPNKMNSAQPSVMKGAKLQLMDKANFTQTEKKNIF